LAIGGFLPLEKVYNFNPIPEELTKEEAKFVLGAQGNIWTEYMSTPEKVEYMVFPRIIALAEVVWSAKEHKNYDDFIRRLEFFNKRLDAKNVQYANHLYEVKGEFINKNGKVFYEFETITKGKDIRFTTDNSEPNSNSKMYEKPIPIEKSQTLKAAVFDKKGTKLGSIFEQKINLHKAVGAKISLNVAPHKAYNAGGAQALINGISGNNKRFGDKEWLGFSGDNVEITIEFDKPTEINAISTRFHNGNGQWIYAPKEISIEFDNGEKRTILLKNNNELLVAVFEKFEQKVVKKLQITVPNYGIIPEGKQGAGNKSWTFIDEIIVE
jgi:hexosaminidase